MTNQIQTAATQLDRPLIGMDRAIVLWLDEKFGKSNSAHTRLSYHATITRFRDALLEMGRDLDGDPDMIALAAQGWVKRGATQKPLKGSTVNQRLAALASFYEYALRMKLLPHRENPIARVQRSGVEAYASAQPISPVTITQQIRRIDRTMLVGQRDYALLAVFLHTGRRLSEVARLCWHALHNDGGNIVLHFAQAKGNKVLIDALPSAAGQALLAWLHGYYGQQLGDLPHDAPLWVSLERNSRGHALTIRAIADICAKRLGATPHQLRHTFSHTMEDAGASVKEIQRRLGHASSATTDIYLQQLRRAQNPYAEELARRFGFDAA
jgi:site-specific recombinase XerD